MGKFIQILKWTLIASVVVTILGLAISNASLRDSIKVYDNNFKALNLERDSINQAAIAYKFSVEQLSYINDSIIEDLNRTRAKLAIKDRELLQMQYIKTEVTVRDSIFIKDTIFKDTFVKLDTLISDKWHSVNIELTPNEIKVNTTYTSELNVFARSAKEILGIPKKCAIGRLFQKKHKVIRVDVIDKNPYSKVKENKFVIIEE